MQIEYLDSDSHFSTYDIALAAYLEIYGHKHVAMDKSNPNMCQFVFKQNNDLNRLLLPFSNSMEFKFHRKIKELKHLINH